MIHWHAGANYMAREISSNKMYFCEWIYIGFLIILGTDIELCFMSMPRTCDGKIPVLHEKLVEELFTNYILSYRMLL